MLSWGDDNMGTSVRNFPSLRYACLSLSIGDVILIFCTKLLVGLILLLALQLVG